MQAFPPIFLKFSQRFRARAALAACLALLGPGPVFASAFYPFVADEPAAIAKLHCLLLVSAAGGNPVSEPSALDDTLGAEGYVAPPTSEGVAFLLGRSWGLPDMHFLLGERAKTLKLEEYRMLSIGVTRWVALQHGLQGTPPERVAQNVVACRMPEMQAPDEGAKQTTIIFQVQDASGQPLKLGYLLSRSKAQRWDIEELVVGDFALVKRLRGPLMEGLSEGGIGKAVDKLRFIGR